MDYMKLIKTENSRTWINYTMIFSSNNVYIYESERHIRTTTNMKATQVVLKSPEPYSWKTHDYQFRWADTVSKGDTSSALKIPHWQENDVLLYTFLCEHCTLEIFFLSSKTERSLVINGSEKSLMRVAFWKFYKIEIDEGVESEIIFRRNTTKPGVDGYWGIDVRSKSDLRDNSDSNMLISVAGTLCLIITVLFVSLMALMYYFLAHYYIVFKLSKAYTGIYHRKSNHINI